MKNIEEIVAGLPEGNIEDICIGEYWTGVLVEVNGQKRHASLEGRKAGILFSILKMRMVFVRYGD